MSEQGLQSRLINIASIYSRATGRSFQTISNLAYGRHDFLEKYQNDQVTVGISKYYEMWDWFETNWPKGVKRPQRPVIKPIAGTNPAST